MATTNTLRSHIAIPDNGHTSTRRGLITEAAAGSLGWKQPWDRSGVTEKHLSPLIHRRLERIHQGEPTSPPVSTLPTVLQCHDMPSTHSNPPTARLTSCEGRRHRQPEEVDRRASSINARANTVVANPYLLAHRALTGLFRTRGQLYPIGGVGRDCIRDIPHASRPRTGV